MVDVAKKPAPAPEETFGEGDVILSPGADQGFGSEDAVQGQGEPVRGPTTRMWERFIGTDIQKDPQQWTRLGTTISGAILGGTLGSRFPLNPVAGALVGSAVGAGLGSALPEATMELGEMIGIVPKGYRDTHGLSNKDLTTVMEGEALLDLATGGGIFAARLVGRGASRWITGIREGGKEVAEIALRNNVAVLPVMVGSRRLPRQMVSIFGRFPFLFSPLSKRAAVANSDLMKAYQALPSRIAPMAAMNSVNLDLITKDAQQFALGLDKSFNEEYTKLFLKADQAGVKVAPTATIGRAKDMITDILKRSPKTATGGISTPTGEMADLQKFLTQNIMPMQTVDKNSGVLITAHQTLGSMDVLLTKVEDQMADFYKAGKIDAYNSLGDIKQQLMTDMQMNSRGTGATAIMQEYKTLDEAYSQTWQELFENSVAKRFGITRRRGVSGIMIDNSKTIPVDRLGDQIMRSGTPEMVDQLHGLVGKENFQNLAAHILDKKIQSSFILEPDGSKVLNLNVSKDAANGTSNFITAMGIDAPGSARYRTMSRLLELSGGLNMKEVEDLTRLSAAVASVEIPNTSLFLARRAGIGGLSAAVKALIPGAVAAGAAGGGATALGTSMSLTGLVAGVAFVGGNRMLAKLISNPKSAQLLRNVMKEEATGMVSKGLTIRAGRIALWGLMQNEIDEASDSGGLYSPTTTRDVKTIREYWRDREELFLDFMDSWYTEAQKELRRGGK